VVNNTLDCIQFEAYLKACVRSSAGARALLFIAVVSQMPLPPDMDRLPVHNTSAHCPLVDGKYCGKGNTDTHTYIVVTQRLALLRDTFCLMAVLTTTEKTRAGAKARGSARDVLRAPETSGM
jgi:hypothetical protein